MSVFPTSYPISQSQCSLSLLSHTLSFDTTVTPADKARIISLQLENERCQEKSMIMDSLLSQLEKVENEKRGLVQQQQQQAHEHHQQRKFLEDSVKAGEVRQVQLIKRVHQLEQQLEQHLQQQQQQQEYHQTQQQQQQQQELLSQYVAETETHELSYEDLLQVFASTRYGGVREGTKAGEGERER